MGNNRKTKKEPWRIAVFSVSILFILYTWIKKDIAAIYASAPKEQILPMIVTTVAVSVLKFAVIAGLVFLAKWVIGQVKNRKMQVNDEEKGDEK